MTAELEYKFIAPIIAAGTSLLVAVVNVIWTYRTNVKLERVKADLAEEKAENDARRDYEYEARKRLYEECEPVFFQLNEASENAVHRILSLARTSRGGHLGLKEGAWLAGEGYYAISTYYNLFAPVALFKLLTNRLTLIDMNVDPFVKARYELMKWSYLCWTDEFELAYLKPSLEYTPNVKDWRGLRKADPTKHWRQGLPLGRLDSAADALLMRTASSNERLMSFGEFEKEYKRENSETKEAFRVVADIFQGFDPRTRPVLWRVLITQAYILNAMQRANRISTEELHMPFTLIQSFSKEERVKLDWRQDGEAVSDIHVLTPFHIAERYLTEHLPKLHNGLSLAASGPIS